MNSEMLGTCGCLHVFVVIALDPLNKAYTEARGQIRILAVCLVASAPAGISEYIDIGSPECKSLVYAVVAVLVLNVELSSAIGGYNIGYES